jgi:hypothetical protein
MAKKSQLRMYTINKGQMEAFLRVWREQVVPLRVKCGFAVDAAWVIEGENRFFWIVSYDGAQEWKTLEDAYITSPERRNMNPEPAQFIAHMEVRFISSVM